ncbi:MAG TPA: nuclear transport factor 2 family protein [Thermoanaerobaculia bacterium]
MRPHAHVLAALTAVLLSASVYADDAEEVKRLDKEITVATWTGDAVWFEENVADEYVLVTPTGGTRTKRDVVRELATPGMQMEPYEPREVILRMYGDAAVITGRVLQRYVLGGIRFANDLRYTNVYVKKKGRWLLVSGHISSVAVKR